MPFYELVANGINDLGSQTMSEPPHSLRRQDEAKRFFEILFGNAQDGYLTISCKAKSAGMRSFSFPIRKLEDAAIKAIELSESNDVFFGVGLQKDMPDPGKRGTAAGVCCIPGFWIDFDVAGPGHIEKDLPPSFDDVQGLMDQFPLKPTLLVHTGGGIHAYYLFSSPLMLPSDEDRKRAHVLCKRFQATFRSYAEERKWKVDPTADLTRLLRVPGTFNLKEDIPRPVRILEYNAKNRYDPSDFDEHMVKLPPKSSKPYAPNSDGSVHQAVRTDYPLAEIGPILDNCGWLRSTLDNADHLAEPEWNEQLVILSGCHDGRRLAHDFSCGYPGYSESETDMKFDKAKGYNPRTCSTIQADFGDSHCEKCLIRGCVSMPIQLGDPSPVKRAVVQIAKALKSMPTDPGAIYTGEALDAFVVIQKARSDIFQRMMSRLRDAKVTVGTFNKALADHMRASLLTQTQSYYRIENNMLIYDKPTAQGPTSVPICNFAISIDTEIIRDDGADQDITFRLNGRLATGEELPTIDVTAAEFCCTDWPLKYYGAKAICYPSSASHLKPAIQSCSDNITQRRVYTHTGWRKIDGEYAFLSAAGGIGENGLITEIEVDLGNDTVNQYALPSPPSGESLVEAIKASLQLLRLVPGHVAYSLLGTMGRAPLNEAYPADFSVFLAGYTGTGKSEVAAIVQRHFGRGFDGKNLPANWSSTANSLEKIAFMAKDVPLVADDFVPKGNANDVAKAHKVAEQVLRAQGNRAGRQRMNADGTLRKTFFPRGIIISTGEDVPRGQSLLARLLILQLGPKDVDFNVLTGMQEQGERGVLAEAMSGYLQWLAPQMGSLKSDLAERQKVYRQKALHLKSVHGRTPDMVANLMIGVEMFLSFANGVNAITESELASMLAEAWKHLLVAAEKQASLQQNECPVARYLTLLTAALQSGQAYLAATNESHPVEPSLWGWTKVESSDGSVQWNARGTKIGWVDGEDVYLISEAAYAVGQKLAQLHGNTLGLGEKSLNRHLKDQGKLLTSDKDAATTRKAINGNRKRVLHLAAETLGGSKQTADQSAATIQFFNDITI